MTNITKAAQDALAELADWHWSQAATLRKAASTSAMDKPEPVQSSLTRMADWHDAQKSLIRAALQDKAGEGERYPSDWFALAMGAAASIEDAANCLRVEDAKRSAEGAAKHVRDKCNALWGSAQPASVVPAGFALVPVEPTPEMWQAVDKFAHAGSVWDTMLAASQQKGKQ